MASERHLQLKTVIINYLRPRWLNPAYLVYLPRAATSPYTLNQSQVAKHSVFPAMCTNSRLDVKGPSGALAPWGVQEVRDNIGSAVYRPSSGIPFYRRVPYVLRNVLGSIRGMYVAGRFRFKELWCSLDVNCFLSTG